MGRKTVGKETEKLKQLKDDYEKQRKQRSSMREAKRLIYTQARDSERKHRRDDPYNRCVVKVIALLNQFLEVIPESTAKALSSEPQISVSVPPVVALGQERRICVRHHSGRGHETLRV